MNKTINEIKNSLGGTNNRITEAEEQISELEDRMVNITVVGQKKECKNVKIIFGTTLRNLWDNIKCTNMHILGAPEGQEA